MGSILLALFIHVQAVGSGLSALCVLALGVAAFLVVL